ncbi:MAG: rhomboid family intramembrane serine protease [Chitinophagales bacterium]
MSMQNNSSIFEDIRYQFNYGTMTNRLIIVNFAVFLMLVIFRLFTSLFQVPFYDGIIEFFMAPSSIANLVFKPWSLITYMFLHEEFFHILFNMIIFYVFGRLLNDFIGNRKILPIYIYGGLAGAILYILAFNLLPALVPYSESSQMLGASAAVMAIMFATVTLRPNFTLFLVFLGAVRIKYIAAFFLLIDLVSISNLENTGGHIAHVGGALFGYLFIKQLQVGNDWSLGFNNTMDSLSAYFSKEPKIVYKNENFEQQQSKKRKADRRTTSSTSDKSYYASSQQDKIDVILDKISESGYDSLTQEEKEFLFTIKRDE